MSIAVLLLSIVFAAIEAGLTWALLAFEPVARLVAGVPTWAITGGMFALGMLLSFILIMIIGGAGITDRAAGFVRDHFGRVLALMLICVILILGFSGSAEFAYQLKGGGRAAGGVIFVLDNSSSMGWEFNEPIGKTKDVALKEAFNAALAKLEDGQYVAMVRYGHSAELVYDWKKLDSQTRTALADTLNAFSFGEGTSFAPALREALEVAEAGIALGIRPSVVMITDGADPDFTSVQDAAPGLIEKKIVVNTIGIDVTEDTVFTDSSITTTPYGILKGIADATGGTTDGVINIQELDDALTEGAKAGAGFVTPDTLLTQRWAGRAALFNAAAMRIILLSLVAFLFKVIVNICIGNNGASLAAHLLISLLTGVIGALAVEFGYRLGLPVTAVLGVFWLLMMGQIVIKDR